MDAAGNSFVSASSSKAHFGEAIEDCVQQLAGQSAAPHLLLVFFAQHTQDRELTLGLERLRMAFPDAQVAGQNVSGTLCNGSEDEEGPAVCLWGATWPKAKVEAFHLQYQRTPEGAAFGGVTSGLERLAAGDEGVERCLVLALADPYTFPMDLFLNRVNEDHPGLPVVGGMASAAAGPGDSRLILNDQIVNHGAVFLLLELQSPFGTLVSQGCRPIGEPMVVTKAERNRVQELGGRPALERFQRVYSELPTRDRRAVHQGLHLGLAINEYSDSFGYGDFLIRNVIGMDDETQTMDVADFVRVGQTVQFHIRDEESADTDLRQKLKESVSKQENTVPAGALVFTCNGRGSHLFSMANHDAQAVVQSLGAVPAAGFFAAGEIGPIDGQNCTHGFTCVVVWFA